MLRRQSHHAALCPTRLAGPPTAPGTPTLTNLISPSKRLQVQFTIPAEANDNAGESAHCRSQVHRQEWGAVTCHMISCGWGTALQACRKLSGRGWAHGFSTPAWLPRSGDSTHSPPGAAGYTFDVIRVDNPSVEGPSDLDTADNTANGYTFVRTNAAVTGTLASDAITFTVPDPALDDALYRVRVKSVNPNSQDPAPSKWSAVIGTGEALRGVLGGWTVEPVGEQVAQCASALRTAAARVPPPTLLCSAKPCLTGPPPRRQPQRAQQPGHQQRVRHTHRHHGGRVPRRPRGESDAGQGFTPAKDGCHTAALWGYPLFASRHGMQFPAPEQPHQPASSPQGLH